VHLCQPPLLALLASGRPVRSGLSARATVKSVSRQRVHGRSPPFLYETDAVADGNQNYFHARIGGDRVVDGTDRGDVLVAREITDDVATLERVVQQD
jgi:hypothetical protein